MAYEFENEKPQTGKLVIGYFQEDRCIAEVLILATKRTTLLKAAEEITKFLAHMISSSAYRSVGEMKIRIETALSA